MSKRKYKFMFTPWWIGGPEMHIVGPDDIYLYSSIIIMEYYE